MAKEIHRQKFLPKIELVFVFLIRGFGASLGFVVTFVVARLYDIEEAGLVFLSLTLVAIISLLSRLGLDTALLKFVGSSSANRCWAEVNLWVTQALVFTITTSLIFCLILYVYIDYIAEIIFVKPAFAAVFRDFLPSVCFIAIATIFSQSFQALGKSKLAVFGASVLPHALFVVAVFLFGANFGAGLLFSISTFVAALLMAAFWVRLPWTALKFGLDRRMIATCLPLMMIIICGQITQWGGQLIAASYVTQSELAILASAQRLSLALNIFVMLINIIAAPRIAALYRQKNREGLIYVTQRATALAVVVCTPVLLLITSGSNILMSLLGDSYAQGSWLLVVLCLGQAICVATGPVGFMLSMTGKEAVLRNITCLVAVVSMLATYYLVIFFGVFGASVGVAVSMALQNVCCYVFAKRALGFHAFSIASIIRLVK